MAYVTSQDYLKRNVRAAAILTNGYVAGTVLGAQSRDANQVITADEVDQFNHLALEVDFTLGSLTNVAIKIEFSEDNSSWYQLQKPSNSSGIISSQLAFYQIAASGSYYFDINADFFNGGGFKTKYIRISSSGVGTLTSSSLTINAIVSTV